MTTDSSQLTTDNYLTTTSSQLPPSGIKSADPIQKAHTYKRSRVNLRILPARCNEGPTFSIIIQLGANFSIDWVAPYLSFYKATMG